MRSIVATYMLALCVLGAPARSALAAGAGAGAGAVPRLVVVPGQAPRAPSIRPQLPLVEKPLRKVATIVPFVAYIKAVRAAGMRPAAATGPDAAVPAGRRLQATHVLVLEAAPDDPRQKIVRKLVVNATLIDVTTGETQLSKRYPLPGRRLDPATARDIVFDVVDRLQASSAPAPVPEATASGAAGAQAATAPPPERPRELPAGTAADAVVPPDAPPPAGDQQTSEVQAQSPRARPALRLAMGLLAFVRTGRILTGNAADSPPCYCEPAGVAAPLFSRIGIQIELFPLAFDHTGAWWEGFGLHTEGSLGFIKTAVGNGASTRSTVGGIFGGVHYRHVLWDSSRAGDVLVKLGLSTASFPLSHAAFVGTGYRSPYAGLVATFPIVDLFAVQAGGNFMPYVSSFGGAEKLGSQKAAGYGYHVEAGGRFTFAEACEVRLTGQLDRYRVPFTETTRLNTTAQYNNVRLDDLQWGGMVHVGYVY